MEWNVLEMYFEYGGDNRVVDVIIGWIIFYYVVVFKGVVIVDNLINDGLIFEVRDKNGDIFLY